MLFSKEPNPLKVVVLGEAQSGKTCFIDMFLEGKHFIRHSAVDSELLSRTISHADDNWSFSFMDIDLQGSISPSYRRVLNEYIGGADGVVLIYDITAQWSWDELIKYTYPHIYHCRNTIFTKDGTEGRMQGVKKRFGCVVVGNKKDMVDEDASKRQVKKDMAEQWAASQGFRHFEISSNERGEVEYVIRALVDSVQRARRMDARDIGDSRRDGEGGITGWGMKVVKRLTNG